MSKTTMTELDARWILGHPVEPGWLVSAGAQRVVCADHAEAMVRSLEGKLDRLRSVHRALRRRVARMESWMEGYAYCPCCQQARQCADGCTFATDCPDDAERMDQIRDLLYRDSSA